MNSSVPQESVAELLRSAREQVLHAWEQRLAGDAPLHVDGELPRPLLRDQVPDLYDRLVDACDVSGGARSEKIARSVGRADEAKPSAQTSVAARSSVAAALRELSHFRVAFIDALRLLAGGARPEIEDVVHAMLDEAMAETAASMHARVREHLGFERAQLRRVLQLLPVGVFIVDANGSMIETNVAAREIWGETPDVSSPRQYGAYEAYWPHSGRRLEADEWALARVLRRGDAVPPEELIIVRNDGSRRTALISAAPLRDQNGALLGAVSVNVDITDRRLVEQELYEAQTELAAILHHAGDGIYGLDAEGRTTFMNPAAAHLTGYSTEELIGVRHHDKVHHTRADGTPYPAEECPIRRAIASGLSVHRDDEIFFRKDGSRFIAEYTATPMLDGNGKPYGAVVVFHDVTERKRTEAVLRAALADRDASLVRVRRVEEELRAFADTIPLLACASAPDGTVRWYNRRWQSYTGTPATPETFDWLSIVAPEDLERTRASWRASLESGHQWEAEFRLRRADGSFRWFLARACPLRDENGQIETWFSTKVDIDDQKAAQNALERDAAFRERFIGVLSHDLRTPIAAISAAASLLLRGQLANRESQLATRVLTSVQRMDRMIRDLLDVTRARHGGGIRISRQPVDLANLCRHVVDEIELAYPGRSIELVTNGSCEGWFDSDRLAQVVSNLVTNALDYSPPDTTVRIEITRDGEGVRLRVHNQGGPIPRASIPSLFDPFTRGSDMPPSAKRKGLGLGLYIVNEIVRAHGGTIEVESETEQGTSFDVWLPCGQR